MISLLCPTRGRPDRFARFKKSVEDTTEGEYEILVGADKDDESFKLYDLSGKKDNQIRVFIGDRTNAVTVSNDLAKRANGNILMIVCDDMTSHTKGWDKIVEQDAPKDGIFVGSAAYGGGEPHTFGREFFDAMGFVSPPHIDHYYGLTWVMDVAQRVLRNASHAIEWQEERLIDETSRYHTRDGYSFIHKDSDWYHNQSSTWTAKYEEILRSKMKG